MTEQTVAAFARRLQSDESLQAELAGADGPDGFLEIARREGFDLGVDDLPAIRAALGAPALSDEELESVSGGAGAITYPIWGPQYVTRGDD